MYHVSSFRREIPFLRRFGRAMTAEQREADVSVIQLINEMLADDTPDEEYPAREHFYRKYLAILRQNTTSCDDAFDTRYSPLSWLCAWLMVVEGFSRSEIATIVDKPLGDIDNLLARQQLESSSQRAARVLIIEDEALIGYDLKRIVTEIGHTVVGIARTKRAALEQFDKAQPEVVLSDVQLADGDTSGIEAAEEIGRRASVPVIFITAFPELLLRGADGEPAYLISKPFDPRVVQATLRQALFLARKGVLRTPVTA